MSVARALRHERQVLYQRELLLDTVIQSSPLALLLCGPTDAVVYSNATARHLKGNGRRLEGHQVPKIMVAVPGSLRSAFEGGRPGLVNRSRGGFRGETRLPVDPVV